ncbi:MAG TPA: hypothetical protein P5572_16980 [Phycisphaerae bacterium]|nr:hypothetical protein [Phycisphaerae bacterium]
MKNTRRDPRVRFLEAGLALAAWIALAGLLPGCEMPGQKVATDQQTVDPVFREIEYLRGEVNRADQERTEARKQIDALNQQLADQQAKAADLEQRLQATETRLASFEGVDVKELATSVESADRDLKQLKGDFVGLDYRVSQRFQDVELIHANLEQADEDLRKHVASSVTGLERRSAAARDELQSNLNDRLVEERSALVSSVRELERQTSADRARAALAMQSVRDALASERTAVTAHAEKLGKAVDDLNAQFGTDGDAARAKQAADAFDEARRLHEQYLSQRHKPELLASAIDAYTRGLALQPNAVDMHYELARLLRVARRTDDAKPHLEYYLAHGEDPERTAQVRSWLGE